MGPEPVWRTEKRDLKLPNLEVYLQLDTEVLEGQAFHMVEVEDGVGLEGGYEFETGIPIRGELLVNNEYLGFNSFKLLELSAGLQFTIHASWDDEAVYPFFEDF